MKDWSFVSSQGNSSSKSRLRRSRQSRIILHSFEQWDTDLHCPTVPSWRHCPPGEPLPRPSCRRPLRNCCCPRTSPSCSRLCPAFPVTLRPPCFSPPLSPVSSSAKTFLLSLKSSMSRRFEFFGDYCGAKSVPTSLGEAGRGEPARDASSVLFSI